MPPFAICLEALHSLAANKLRSGLTMLGMVIGVASVIVMVAIGQGSQRAIKQTIATLGSNLLIISPPDDVLMRPTLFERDAAALQALPILQWTASIVSVPSTMLLSHDSAIFNIPIFGVTPAFFLLREWGVSRGTLFNQDDVTHEANIAILGQSAAKKIFKQANPVGQFITMNGLHIKIAGVLRPKGQTLDGRDQDFLVLVPQSVARARLMGENIHDTVNLIYTRSHPEVSQDTVLLYITRALRASHALEPFAPDDFKISDVKSVAEGALTAGRTMTMLLASIASVSLVVGGIGIMNIMLVCVTERTREIGIRKAIGATRSIILLQFLCEAVMIAFIGCMVGMFLGISITALGAAKFDIPVELNAWPIAAAFGVSMATGVFFGLYPARKAASLIPVEALKY